MGKKRRKNCYLYSDIRYLSFATFVTGKRGEKRVFLFSFFPFFRTNKREIAALTLKKKVAPRASFHTTLYTRQGQKKVDEKEIIGEGIISEGEKRKKKASYLNKHGKAPFLLGKSLFFFPLKSLESKKQETKIDFFRCDIRSFISLATPKRHFYSQPTMKSGRYHFRKSLPTNKQTLPEIGSPV